MAVKLYKMDLVIRIKVEANDAREARVEAAKIARTIKADIAKADGLPLGASWHATERTAPVNLI